MPPPYNLRPDPDDLVDGYEETAPEIFERHRDTRIMDGQYDAENAHYLVGFASRCWTPDGVFDTDRALQAANELCYYLRRARAEGPTYNNPSATDAMRIMDRTIRGGGEALFLADPVRRALKVRT